MGATTSGSGRPQRSGRRRDRSERRSSHPTLTHRPLRWATRGPRPRRHAAQHRRGPPVPPRAGRRRRAGPPARHGPLRPERRQPPGLAGHRGQGPRRPAPRCATSTSSGWYEYLAMVSAGLVPWAPVTDRAAEAAAIANARAVRRGGRRRTRLRRDARHRARPPARPGRPVRARRGRPRPAALHPRRRCLHLPLRLEPAAGRPDRGPRRRHDHHAGAPRGRRARALRHPRHGGGGRPSSCSAAR